MKITRTKIVVGCLLILSVLMACEYALSNGKSDVEKVSAGILWLVTPNEARIPGRVASYTGTRAYSDPSYRVELAKAFLDAAERYDVSPWLLVGMSYRETVFRMNGIGDGGKSVGLMQVGKMGRRACRDVCGGMETAHEQIMCGACWLDKGRQWCGSLDGGLSAYISGECKLRTVRAKRAFQNRKNLETVLGERFGECK